MCLFSRQILAILGAHLDSNHPFHQEMKGLERPVLKVRRFTKMSGTKPINGGTSIKMPYFQLVNGDYGIPVTAKCSIAKTSGPESGEW